MIRNLKVPGLALVAVFAMGAVLASSASAASFTAESYPAHIVGHDAAGESSVLTGLFGISLECEETSYTAEIESATEELEVTPAYGGCHSGARGATYTTNGCTYIRGSAQLIEPHTYAVSTRLVCPTGKKVEIHIYNNASHASGTWCTLTISPQIGMSGEHVTDTTNGILDFSGTIHELPAQTHGTCSFGLTIEFEGELDEHVEASAVNGETEEPDPIDVG